LEIKPDRIEMRQLVKHIRPAAVAGTFYPAQPEQLEGLVKDLLAAVSLNSAPGPARAIIVPHAGYAYSGPTAAAGFSVLRYGQAEWRPRRVVIIGPAHYLSFSGIAAPSATAFRTPLGDLPVDHDAIDSVASLPQVLIADEPHSPEHSLEVELPFVRVVFGAIPIVPLLIGRIRAEQVAEVLARLWDPYTLVIVSTDLSHYLDYDEARRRDAATATAIENLDDDSISEQDACGATALCGLLLEARRRAMKIERVDLRNSGDTGGGRRQVVGYGAWAVHL
jgi:AmmeMemoRadiSam system protein B